MESLSQQQRALFVAGGQLDDYEVLKPIGKGKFSVVYKGKRKRDGQPIALKKVAIFDMMDAKAREDAQRGACVFVRLVQSVSHPNIIQYLDAFIANNELYIAFEWAEAGDLKRQIRKANEKGVRFDERTIWRYFAQLCAAIPHMQQARIMHRDLNQQFVASTVLTKKHEQWRRHPHIRKPRGPQAEAPGSAHGAALRAIEAAALLGVDFEPETTMTPAALPSERSSPVMVAQLMLLGAKRAGVEVASIAQMSAPALTSGSSEEVCVLFDLLCTKALQATKRSVFQFPSYPKEAVDEMEAQDNLEVGTDDNNNNDGEFGEWGDSTASTPGLGDDEEEDAFAKWLVVKDERPNHIAGGAPGATSNRDQEREMIRSRIDPAAWRRELERITPKL